MSTEDQPPRTRAEARAAREAAEQEEAKRAEATEPPAEATEPPAAASGEPDAFQRASIALGGQPKTAPRSPREDRTEASKPPEVPVAPAEVLAEQDAFRLAVPAEPSEPEPVSPSPREEQGAASRPPSRRRFFITMFAVVGILAVVVAGLGVISLFQGPRLSSVQVNPAEAIETSGSRIILTSNQALEGIDESQITVDPAVPFTVDAAGRGIGIRFTVPLDDDTDYTVSVAGVTGTGGGPSADLTTTFSTPPSEIFLLRRSAEGDDSIFRTDLSGEKAVPVFTHPRINDYRATATQLVVAVEDDDGSKVLVMDRDGKNQRELELPGNGYVSSVQVSDRGGLVGYVYSDRELSETSGRASVLVTQSLTGNDDPEIVEVGDEEASIAEWHFVPDSAAVLFIDFDGTLSLDDRSGDAGAQNLGTAMTIQGISRGTYTAIIEHVDGTTVELNLADGSETPLAASDPDYGPATTITPYPGGTLRHVVARDAAGLPTGQAIIRVDDDGMASPLIDVPASSAILQACASPSGQYAAVVIAPDLAENAYDDMLVPLPKDVQTHLMDLRTGDEIVALTGFDISWCQIAPSF